MKIEINLDNHIWPKFEDMDDSQKRYIVNNQKNFVCHVCKQSLFVVAFGKGYVQRPHLKIQRGLVHHKECGRVYLNSDNTLITSNKIIFEDIDFLFYKLFNLDNDFDGVFTEIKSDLMKKSNINKKYISELSKKAPIKDISKTSKFGLNEIYYFSGVTKIRFNQYLYRNRQTQKRDVKESIDLIFKNVKVHISGEYFDLINKEIIDYLRENSSFDTTIVISVTFVLINRFDDKFSVYGNNTLNTYSPNEILLRFNDWE